jgi:hypothetical protein
MQSPSQSPIREDMQQRIEQFAGRVVTDLAAAMAGVMTNLGHKLGLYRTMAESGPINSFELAHRTGTNERSVREWLNGQVAGGYVLFDTNTSRYVLPPEHVFVLANPDSPAFLPPAFDVAASLWHSEDKLLAAFRSGNGVGWHEHNCRLFTGTEAFFRNGYRAHLTQNWIPSLSGIQEQLAKGGHVADLGCGHGARRPFSWHKHFRSRRSWELTTMNLRLPWHGNEQIKPEWPTAFGLKWELRGCLRAARRNSTSFALWILCTTWVIRWKQPGLPCRQWLPTAHSCW